MPIGGAAFNNAPIRVLVVDDDAAARVSLTTSLSLDFQVAACSDGPRAEVELGIHEYEVLLVDYEMPGMSGTELLRRARSRYPNTVGILVTGHSDLLEVKRAKTDDDVFLVVLKPYDPRELMRWVTMAGRTSRLRKADASHEWTEKKQ